MTIAGLEFVVLVVSALSLFGGVLGWACWMESREAKKAAQPARVAIKPPETADKRAHRAF